MAHLRWLTPVILLGPILLALSGPADGAIYKFRDQDGHLRFSDRPPADGQAAEIIETRQPAKTPVDADIRKRLVKKFRPSTPVELATLSVVTIETAAGTGSGFFISSDGLIVTNRHVVRLSPARKKKNEEKLQRQQQQLDKMKSRIDQEKRNLRQYQLEIMREEERITDLGIDSAIQEAELEVYRSRHRVLREEVEKAEQNYRKLRRKHQNARADLRREQGQLATADRFLCHLKDGTQVEAELVALGEQNDLALLQLTGYTTPYLKPGATRDLSQGQPVYAIGSPIGKADYVTSGIITKVTGNRIVTDTQILPGNSGGPLIDEQGRVVAVNTQKFTRGGSSHTDGFGLSLPIGLVLREFGALMRSKETQQDSETDL